MKSVELKSKSSVPQYNNIIIVSQRCEMRCFNPWSLSGNGVNWMYINVSSMMADGDWCISTLILDVLLIYCKILFISAPLPPGYKPTQNPLQNCINSGLTTRILRYLIPSSQHHWPMMTSRNIAIHNYMYVS